MFDTFTKQCTRNYTAAYTLRATNLVIRTNEKEYPNAVIYQLRTNLRGDSIFGHIYLLPPLKIKVHDQKTLSYFATKTYDMDSQKNRLKEHPKQTYA